MAALQVGAPLRHLPPPTPPPAATHGRSPACSPALTLVCKRWRDAAYQEEAIWRHFRLDARALHSLRPPAQKRRWLEGHAALLRRVAGMVQEAELIAPRGLPRRPAVAAHAQLADLVRLLQPAALTCLTLRCAAEGADAQQAAVAAALRRLLRLEELHLELNRPPASMPKALGRLHSLRCLSLRATAIAPALVASVAQLSGLTCLGLHLMHRRHCLPGGALGALTALTGLRRLELSENADDPRDDEDEEEGAEGWPQLPPPAAFPALTLYDYQTCERSFQVGRPAALEQAQPCPSYAQPCSATPRAACAHLEWCPTCLPLPLLPAQIAACPAARMCRCACALVYIGAARTPAWRVELGEAWVQADLQQLLDALLPRGAPADLPLVLVLDGCCLAAPACTAGCPALCHAVGLGLFNFRTQAPHFPSLHYDPANEPPERQAAGLPAVLALLPGLQALTLDASATPEDEHPSLPESVARLRGLTSLTLDGLDLDDLPPGPYLAGELQWDRCSWGHSTRVHCSLLPMQDGASTACITPCFPPLLCPAACRPALPLPAMERL